MITIFVHVHNRYPARRLLRTTRGALSHVQVVFYQDAFRNLSVPSGTLIFTDFDFLTAHQMEAASNMAQAALAANPATRILNHPCYACERFELLRRLKAEGLTPTEILRLDSGEIPSKYPVFIRSEDAAYGPETGLLEDETAFHAAVAALRASGKPVKRRVVISYEGEPDEKGFFRKYGAIRIGDHVVPQHLFFSRTWIANSAADAIDEECIAEELAYTRANPHKDLIRRAFDVGHLQFGRMDFAFKQGAPVIFEINTHPVMPRFDGAGRRNRNERREIVFEALTTAFQDIDEPGARGPRIEFAPPEPSSKFLDTRSWSPWARWLWRRRRRMRLGSLR